jgi:hypothetical protein
LMIPEKMLRTFRLISNRPLPMPPNATLSHEFDEFSA